MPKRIAAVVAGYFVFAVSAVALFAITGHDPHGDASHAFKIGSTLYGMFFALIGGALAARIGGSANQGRALAFLIAIIAIISMFSGGSHWSQLHALLFMAPCAAIGGKLSKAPQT